MKFIPTSTFTVEQLKKQAKKLQRAKGGKHSDCLNLAAQKVGYQHWHHVSLCAKHTARLGVHSLSEECFYVMQEVRRGNSLVVLTGRETANVPFVLFGFNHDVWLFEPKNYMAVCLMLHGEEQTITFEETETRIHIAWTHNIVRIQGCFLVLADGHTGQEKGFSYPNDVLEQLIDFLLKARSLVA